MISGSLWEALWIPSQTCFPTLVSEQWSRVWDEVWEALQALLELRSQMFENGEDNHGSATVLDGSVCIIVWLPFLKLGLGIVF